MSIAPFVRNAVTALGAEPYLHQAPLPLAERQSGVLQRTLQIEWAYREIFTSNQARTDALAPWLEFYNTDRRHSAIGGLPPDEPTVMNVPAEDT